MEVTSVNQRRRIYSFKMALFHSFQCFFLFYIGYSACHVLLASDSYRKSDTNKLCDECPSGGKCVPYVQCSAHVRPNFNSQACHLTKGYHGICCRTFQNHASEQDMLKNEGSLLPTSLSSRSKSYTKNQFETWKKFVQELSSIPEVKLSRSEPSYVHHMSVRSFDDKVESNGEIGVQNLITARTLLSFGETTIDELQLGLTNFLNFSQCTPLNCNYNDYDNKYRDVSGKCNNMKINGWGAVNTPYARLLPPLYNDGAWEMRLAISGRPLPSARTVSREILQDGHYPSETHNLMFVQFGQFIAHDVTSNVPFTLENGTAISCCSQDNSRLIQQNLRHPGCAAIVVDEDDDFYIQYGQRCINFVRTQLASTADCSLGIAEQMNGVTHFLDLSQLYGSTKEKLEELRDEKGRLKVFSDYDRDLPPLTSRQECQIHSPEFACFDSGNNKINQMVSLVGIHTIWIREHNRVAKALARLNPELEKDDDRLFYETRRIVQAEYQHIIYNEWLPLLIGVELMSVFDLLPIPAGYSSGYFYTVNPSVTTEFAAAAFRFGHSAVDNNLNLNANGAVLQKLSISEVMFQPSQMRLKNFLDHMIRGLISQPMQEVDHHVSDALRKYMFHGGKPFGLDLAAINIQRGRDHGLRSYNEYRQLVGLHQSKYSYEFDQIVFDRLGNTYESLNDVDLWIGGLLEDPINQAIVGPTFASILADQFFRFKQGDRYFYEHGPQFNSGAFSRTELAEIKKVTFARIICDNRDGYEFVSLPLKVFLQTNQLVRNKEVSCSSPELPEMDLSRFRLL